MKYKNQTSDYLLFLTVRICGKTADGAESFGTGFFYEFGAALPDGRLNVMLVTNRHVIKGLASGVVRLHLHKEGDVNQPGDQSVELKIPDFGLLWVGHPNPEIDLCAASMAEICKAGLIDEDMIYASAVSGSEDVLSDEQLGNLCAIENVVMIGYPGGIWDDVNNLPVIRKGITASHPAVDFQGRPEALLDMACFWGSSGSPILTWDEGTSISAHHPSAAYRRKPVLLGVLQQLCTYQQNGEIQIQNVPTKWAGSITFAAALHLGVYCKAKELHMLSKIVERRLIEFESR